MGPNAFIHTFPNELDLLVVRKDAEPMQFTNMYMADKVIAVIGIKTTGVFNLKDIDKQVTVFDSIKNKFPGIDCLYISLQERATENPEAINYVTKTKTALETRGYGAFIFRDTRTKNIFSGSLKVLRKDLHPTLRIKTYKKP